MPTYWSVVSAVRPHQRIWAIVMRASGNGSDAADRATLLTIDLMPTEHILALLIAERDKLNRAIEALQGSPKRVGRPPKSDTPVVEPNSAAPKNAM